MKLATLRTGQGTTAAVERDGTFRTLPFDDVGALLRTGPAKIEKQMAADGIPVDEADFAPLVTAPGKIICVGLNYRTHIREMNRELPTHPTLFAKFADALIGANDDIVLPPGSSAVDWEAELALVIGETVSRATEQQAGEAIAGFTVANDISARDFQKYTLQWLQGKTFDQTTPLGPTLVTVDETGLDPDLSLECRVDDVLKQQARTNDLVFPPTALVRYISAITTLRPGDVILTGTPGGVGAGRDPQEFLSEGRTVTTRIAGIGACHNLCSAR
ncbi:fumarylacetoacetate hydrolase family protein [Salinisphaera sp. Q1T1-3]|uniref:fumarylacetoacetate hydrolase family protein n=1 Tax=Salinisphaera sp. Q1T1-3 TaxID=2321229 RepID=UPI000E72AB33|nr:fumarylacetoacetate hydrolase family protein [Salinisphaera sp. Q1T1-3]RJS92918.1 FAA hydrolase family protein [Salinisphaera sp. Q1T1-3]